MCNFHDNYHNLVLHSLFLPLCEVPLEMEMLTREHFNRWYSIFPYFLSIILFEVPFQVTVHIIAFSSFAYLFHNIYLCQTLCSVGYVLMSYFLTGNYLEEIRFYYFISFTVLTALSAQSWGFFIGAILPIKVIQKFLKPNQCKIISISFHSIHSLQYLLVQYWQYYSVCSDSVHHILISHPYSVGCGT